MNERALKFLIRRDGGDKGKDLRCCFCRLPFKSGAKGGQKMVIDHLDCNPKNNQYYNLALCHQACNQKKRTYGDYQLLAIETIKRNAAYVPQVLETPADDRENENVRASDAISKFVRDYLEINCPPGTVLELQETARSISYLCRQRFSMGAPDTILRHIGVYTSGPAPWALTDVNGQRVISKRIEAGGDEAE